MKMREFFFHKRGPARTPTQKRNDPHTQVLYVRGFTSVDGAKNADHIINVTMGSHSRELSRTYTRLCDALNQVMERYYNGEFN